MLVEPTVSAHQSVTGAIRQASQVTGTSFQYLLATAHVESRLNPAAAAPASSARGLFQFIEQTWLATMKTHGAAYGYGQVANAIQRAPSGQYEVADPKQRDAILKLRSDPVANAVMAGAFTRSNATRLAGALGREPNDGELYLAHFLGPRGAERLIGLAERSPQTRASDAFPSAARSNRSIFYDRQGRARSVSDVHRTLIARYDVARGTQAAPEFAAAAKQTAKPKVAYAPDTAQLTEAYAAASRVSVHHHGHVSRDMPVFHGLFRTPERSEPVAPVVSALWNDPTQSRQHPVANAIDGQNISPNTAQRAVPPAPERSMPLDLFQDQAPDAIALFRGRV